MPKLLHEKSYRPVTLPFYCVDGYCKKPNTM